MVPSVLMAVGEGEAGAANALSVTATVPRTRPWTPTIQLRRLGQLLANAVPQVTGFDAFAMPHVLLGAQRLQLGNAASCERLRSALKSPKSYAGCRY